MLAAVLIAGLCAPAPQPDPNALEAKLHGVWKGGACVGELTVKADGTFERRHYTPGNNTLSGTWAVRWDALPPTLALTCTASDAPDRIKVGETTAVKLVRLDGEALAYQHPGGPPVRYARVKAGGGRPAGGPAAVRPADPDGHRRMVRAFVAGIEKRPK
jgi:hypothetical protein